VNEKVSVLAASLCRGKQRAEDGMDIEPDTCTNSVQHQASVGCWWAHTGLGPASVVCENHAVHTKARVSCG